MPRKYKKIERDPKPRTRVKEDSRVQCIALIDAGLNTSQIEEQTGVSRSQIRRYKHNLRLYSDPSAPRVKKPGRPRKNKTSEQEAVEGRADDDAAQETVDVFQPSCIIELAAIISTNTAKIDAYLQQKRLPRPSFGVDAPVDVIPSDAAPEVHVWRAEVLEATAELQDLLHGPRQLLKPALNGTSIQAISRYNLAKKVPINGTIAYMQLAKMSNISEVDVRRLLRYAMVHHRMFCEPTIGHVAHTAASRLLAEDKSVQREVDMLVNNVWPSYARTVDAMQRSGSDEPHMSGFSFAKDIKVSTHEYFDLQGLKRKDFEGAIQSLTSTRLRQPRSDSSSTNNVFAATSQLDGFQWASVPPGNTVVVFGGSQDDSVVRLVEASHHLRFMIHDSAENIAQAAPVSTHLTDRVNFIAHDYFTDKPLANADIYLIHRVMRRWSDKYCARFLQKLVPALAPGARVLIHDILQPEPGVQSLLTERQTRADDLLMMTLFNSRERERGDWVKLLSRADKRLQTENIKVFDALPVSGLGLIEAVWTS